MSGLSAAGYQLIRASRRAVLATITREGRARLVPICFWMPDWMGIYYAGDLENGFHALPILPNGQRLWANDLGTPVSYGCIVLGVQEAQELYNWASVGTTVRIDP